MGIWSDTFGGGNSFSESVANVFTPNDGASYVGGQLVDDATQQPISAGGQTSTGNTISGNMNDSSNDNYTIQSGDTLSEIAQANNTTVSALMEANPNITDANVIQAGATLNMPSSSTSTSNNNTTSNNNNDGGDNGSSTSNNTGDGTSTSTETQTATEQITTTAENIKKMAEEAGLVQNEADAQAILADPMKFLEDRGLKVSDLLPTMDDDAEGTTLDADDPNYDIGENYGFEATTVDDATIVDDITAKEGTTYEAAQAKITDAEMMNAVTGTVSDEAQVDAEEYTIDMTGAATGVNEDGTKNELGLALNDWASVDMSKIIDTTTTAGKLLADKLKAEGKDFVDAKTSILWQMKTIAAEFKDANGNPIIPPWAQAQAREVSKSIAFSGISGSAATAAMSNAIMEATLGVAEKEATFFQTLTTTNLNNKQEAIINKANILSKIEMANLDVRSQAAIQNAKAFLEMDLTNLNNEQQAEMVNKQALVQALFENTKAENAARRFGAETANDMAKFYDELQVAIDRHNSSEMNALAKFNAGEINDAAQFNADLKNDRDKFMAEMQYQIDLANAKWRQTVETENFRAEVDAHTADVKAALDLTQEQQNQLWDYADNLLDYIWKTTDNEQERELRLLVNQMQAQSGQSSGGGFLSGLLQLGGAFLGSTSGSAWLAKILPFSDIRLKENIEYYDTLKGIDFYTWDWNEKGKKIGADKYPSFGVLAQVIQKSHPEAVVTGEDGYLRVNYGMIQNGL